MASPRFDLDWEEGVFRGLLSLWRRVSHRDDVSSLGSSAVLLESEQHPLTVFAQLIAGEPVRIREARDVGGVRGRDLLIPRRMERADTREENRELLLVRVAVSAGMRRLTREQCLPSDEAAAALASLRMARAACDWLKQEFALFEDAYEVSVAREIASRPDAVSLRGRARILEEARRDALEGGEPWNDPGLEGALRSAKTSGAVSESVLIWGDWLPNLEPVPEGGAAGEEPPGSEVEGEHDAPAIEGMRRVELDERDQENAVLIHVFEKVETADEYSGGARDTDGADELDAHLEALDEVDLGDVLRGGDAAHSILRSDIQLGLEIPDVESVGPRERGIAYDEWDVRRREYRRNWCTIYPTAMPVSQKSSDAGWAAQSLVRNRRLVNDLERRLEIHRTQRDPIGRQFDGDDIDLAALVDNHAAVAAGRGDDPRVYTRQIKRRRDFATTVLLDISLSSDSWVSNRRVLDVSRDAVLVLGEVADRLGDQLQVLAFASNTRNVCRVWEIKGWRDAWALARLRLGSLEPQGYTRIGSALRHATAQLKSQTVDKRLLLLVSDGKATDYDRYEGRYGIADVRQALREADRVGVTAHALAVDAIARDTLPPMFGPGAWHVLPNPDRLPEVLTMVYGRLSS